MAYHLNGFQFDRPESELASAYHPSPYGIYETSDGYMALSLSPLSTLLKVDEFSELSSFSEGQQLSHRDEIRWILEAVIRTRSTSVWLARFADLGIWAGPVYGYDDVFDDPQVQYVRPTVTMDYPGVGEFRALGLPFTLEGYEPEMVRPPKLSEHTRQILSELGFAPKEIGEMQSEGAV